MALRRDLQRRSPDPLHDASHGRARPAAHPVWTESKQRQREALKKLAHGQRLENIESFEEDEGYSFGMSM